MNYTVYFATGVERDISRLPKSVFRRVDAVIMSLAGEPRPHQCTKLKGRDHLYRVRVGDWRVVYEVDDSSRTLTIQIVAHRSQVYRGI